MVATAHLVDRLIRASRERVWEALTDPDLTEQYFFGARIDSTFNPGQMCRYVLADDSDIIEGTLETVDRPNRLAMTFRALGTPEMAGEPPGRVEWTLAAVGSGAEAVTRVTLRHGDLALSPATWEHGRSRWPVVLDGLKTLLETGAPLPPVEIEASALDPGDIEGNWHRAQAVTANSSAWELLDGRSHTPDDADELLHRAYTSAYHWHRAAGATELNQTRASWLASRAHATLGHGEPALQHAAQSAAHLIRAGDAAADFDQAYVYEARARALACLDRLDEAREAYRRARCVPIADDQDRSIFESDLAAGPWFGLDIDSASH